MNAWLGEVLGPYTLRFYSIFVDELQFCMAAAFFCAALRRRRLFPLRLLGGLLVLNLFMWAAVWLRTEADSLPIRMVFTFLQYLSTLPLMLLCFEEDWTLLLRTWCTSVAVKEIGAGIYPVLQFLLGYDPNQTIQLLPISDPALYDLQWLIYLAVHALIYFLLWLAVRGRLEREPIEKEGRRSAVVLSLVSLLLLSLLGSVSNHYRDESLVLYICTRLFSMAVAVFILLQYAGLEFRSRARTEMAMMERILSEERKQYTQMKENVEVINTLCHDLKHQLADFSGRLTDREIAELQEAMQLYDANIKTGCEALDVVLYIHQLTCRKEGILLTCLADGEALSFMRTRHVYALFNNAIGNAIEAVRKVPEQERRVIGLTVAREGGNIAIEVTNYCVPEAVTGGTSKDDKAHHGFGTKSMRYIAEQYKGSLTVETGGGVYTLRITLPAPPETRTA